MGMQLPAEQTAFTEMEDVNFTDVELAYYVREALKSVSSGESDNYNQLIGVLHHSQHLTPDEVALLLTSLKALSGAVSYIDIVHHKSLLYSISSMSLWNYGLDVMDALLELIVSLAASSGKYLDLCLDMLVSNFMPPSSFLDQLEQPRGQKKKDQVISRMHKALKEIADLIPLAPSRLIDIIYERMPNIFTKESLHVIFVENMLRLESGAVGEAVGSRMLVAVVDRLVDLDVEIGWDEILQDDSSKGIFEMELEDVEGFADEDDQNVDEVLRSYSSRKMFGGNLIAQKLDSLMAVTFEHIKFCNDVGRLPLVFETLLMSFQTTVLNAYKSKFAQFVMFYASSLDPENCGSKFVSMLANIFVSGVYPELWRMSAVAYLASYLARAKFLSASDIASILRSLVNWCCDYCKSQDGDINPKVHKVFYAGCQAIMYVLCFRMRSLLVVPRLKLQLVAMPIEAILNHPLNPLKVCLPSIVEEFLRQAKVACLFTTSETFIFNGLLESELSRAFGGLERLDMFFPFDPCLLKKSDRFIRPSFVFWSMVRTCDDEDEGGTSDEEDIDDDFIGGNGIARSYEENDDDLDLDVSKMSITPRNSLNYGFGAQLHVGMQMPSRIRPSTSPESL